MTSRNEILRKEDKMVTMEHEYLDLLEFILKRGEPRADRTGTGTLAVFGQQLRIDLSKGFPLLTTKKVPFNSVLSELLWFIEGSGDERRLAEILHGTRDTSKKTIWSPNAAGTTGAKFHPKFEGDLGRVYGVQWRHWQNGQHEPKIDKDGHTWQMPVEIDQLAEVIHKLKHNLTDRRIVLTAWNPGELDQMALPPCHMFCQFYLSNDRKLSCQMYQRSVDSFLGLPFNIASYALLTHMIAHAVGAGVGELIMALGDTHIYKDHVEQVREQLSREPFMLPQLAITRQVQSIDDFEMTDFSLIGYQHHEPIKAKMST
jgi:thymidylate synthase